MEEEFADFTLKIPLTDQAEIVVRKEQKVSEDEVLTRLHCTKTARIELAPALGVKPVKVAGFLEVGPGRQVKEGQVLAKRKTFLKVKKVFSPLSGEVSYFDQTSGILEINSDQEPITIRSPVCARVTKVDKNFLTLVFPALVLAADQTLGKSGWGNLEKSSGQIFDLKQMGGKIALVAELNLALVNKLEALGATGAVCLRAKQEIEKDLEQLGVLVVKKADFEIAWRQVGKRAKIDVGDKRLIIAK